MQQVKIKIDDGQAKVSLLSSGNRTIQRMESLLKDMSICAGSMPQDIRESAMRANSAVGELKEKLNGKE